MPATTDGVPRGSVTEQREWFWLNFSQELARAKAACGTDAERERLDHLRNGVLWLHNAIWNIHRIRLISQPDALNEAAAPHISLGSRVRVPPLLLTMASAGRGCLRSLELDGA